MANHSSLARRRAAARRRARQQRSSSAAPPTTLNSSGVAQPLPATSTPVKRDRFDVWQAVWTALGVIAVVLTIMQTSCISQSNDIATEKAISRLADIGNSISQQQSELANQSAELGEQADALSNMVAVNREVVNVAVESLAEARRGVSADVKAVTLQQAQHIDMSVEIPTFQMSKGVRGQIKLENKSPLTIYNLKFWSSVSLVPHGTVGNAFSNLTYRDRSLIGPLATHTWVSDIEPLMTYQREAILAGAIWIVVAGRAEWTDGAGVPHRRHVCLAVARTERGDVDRLECEAPQQY